LQQLKSDPTLIITKDDEGNITTVLDKECYDHKIKKCWMTKELTNISKPTQPCPQTKMSINVLTTFSKSKRTQRKQALN